LCLSVLNKQVRSIGEVKTRFNNSRRKHGRLLAHFPMSSHATCRQQETAEQFIERVKKAIENDEWSRAQAGARHALALKPRSPEALFLAAKVYLHEGAPSMAIESLKNAIENQPVYPEAHFLLSRCLLDAGQSSNAREEANIAIGQGASLFSAYQLLGEIDFAEGKLKFSPARKNGNPIPVWTKVMIEFNLR
jgi:tetratricopeptide (TPR) repeat protein